MRRYAGGAARRGAEPPKMQCAVLERRRRRRAWRITDLASSGSAAPDTPSTTVSFPFLRAPHRPAPRRRWPGTARPHAPPDCSFRIRLSSLFIIRHCRCRCRIAFRVRDISPLKAWNCRRQRTKRHRKQCLVLNKEKRTMCTPIIDGLREARRKNTKLSNGENDFFPIFISERSRVKELRFSCLFTLYINGKLIMQIMLRNTFKYYFILKRHFLKIQFPHPFCAPYSLYVIILVAFI